MLLLISGLAFFFLVSLLIQNSSQFIQVWVPPWPWRQYSYPLMIAACILMAAAILPRSWLRTHLRRPALLAVSLWGIAHLLSNGDLASILLFGTLTLWSLWQYARNFPASTLGAGKEFSVQWDVAAIMAGLLAWVVLYLGHGELFGTGLDIWYP
ncbi:MAG: NnrU family protein [Pseudomonadales bacterium]|nr:NnrU family protein [Pseudomonadales bacterium]